MSTGTIYRISSDNLKKTEELAALVGARLRGGEVIALASDLGGGKTAFVRGLARGMGSSDHVASPTFTIARQYQSPGKGLTLHHFDFYRLQEAGIMSNELAEVIDDPNAVVAVEWGEIVEEVLPEKRLGVSITRTGEDTRDFAFTCPPELAYLMPESFTC